MEWIEILLKKSRDKTLTKKEVLHSLFHMIEVNENNLNEIKMERGNFGPELEEFKNSEISEIDFHIKYYRGLVNFINNFSENQNK